MTETVYENPWFRVLKNGTYFWVDEPKAKAGAAVMLMVDAREIVLVEARRPLHGGTELEIPRGYGEPGETSQDCARRELREETGFSIPLERIRKLGTILPNSSILSTTVDIYLAEGTEADCVGTHDDEVGGVKRLTVASFRQKVLTGEIRDAMTLSALAMWLAPV